MTDHGAELGAVISAYRRGSEVAWEEDIRLARVLISSVALNPVLAEAWDRGAVAMSTYYAGSGTVDGWPKNPYRVTTSMGADT